MLKSESLNQGLNRILHLEPKAPAYASTEAFNDLYETTYLSVFRYVYGLTGGPRTEVEDITAEAYLRAWKNRLTYLDKPQNGVRWIMKIAHNLVIDRYRHNKIDIQITDDSINEESPDKSQEIHPEETLVNHEKHQYMMNLLTILPAEQREILVLRYFLDWKVQQIGQYLEIPENNVSVSIHRALEKLRANCKLDKEEIK